MLRSSTLIAAAVALMAVALPETAMAEEAKATETAYIFNTFSFLIHGVLVMFMAAGFTMLESGLVRSKNVTTICLKNVSLYAIACLTYAAVGYNLMYSGVDGGFIGTPALWFADDSQEPDARPAQLSYLRIGKLSQGPANRRERSPVRR